MKILQEQLKQLHKIELKALIKFDKICQNHHITYTLAGGTLLGAIRHKGFIPWDDDVDVMLLRSEFEKLRKIDTQEWGEDYFYQSYKTDHHYMYTYDKLRVNGTYFGEEALENTGIKNNGVFIDIFPADEVPLGKKGELQILKFKILRLIFMAKYININHRHGIEKKTAKVLRVLFKNISLDKLYHENDALIQKYDGIGTNLYRTFDSFGVKKETYEKRYLIEVKETNFEGYPLKISKYYNEILSEYYGNYMKLPSKSEQVNKHEVVGLTL